MNHRKELQGFALISKITNFKHQITNKSQIPMTNHQNMFGISDIVNFFDICFFRRKKSNQHCRWKYWTEGNRSANRSAQRLQRFF